MDNTTTTKETEIERLNAQVAQLQRENATLRANYSKLEQSFMAIKCDWLLLCEKGSRLVIRASDVIDFDLDPENLSDAAKRLKRAVKLYHMWKSEIINRIGKS